MYRKIFKKISFFLLVFISLTSKFVAAQQDTLQGIGEEVVVTGQHTPQQLKNSVYKVRTINAERIKMRSATDIIGVLNSEIGIRFSSDNTLGETDTKIFGLGTSRVKILIDGVPMADRDATKQSLTQIDINSIEKIEIVEGPMSVVYGTDALAGVINIITKKGAKSGNNLSVTAKVHEETIANTYSPFKGNGIHNENISIHWNNHYWRASGYVTRNDFDGYSDTAAFPAKVFKPKKQWMSGGAFGYSNNKINVWYRLDYLNEELLSANPMNTNTYKSFRQYYITNRFTHQVQADWKINETAKLNTAISFQDYKRNTKSYTLDYQNESLTPNNSPQDLNNGYWDVTPFQTWFFRSSFSWTASPKISIQPGIDVKYDKTSGQRISGVPSITDYSFFVSSEIKPTSAINIRPGFRVSKNSVYDVPPLVPSLNTKFVLNKKLDLRLSYAKGFRAPILRELYFNFFDANHSIQGNLNLKAETSNSFMATLTGNFIAKKEASFTSSITGFFNDYKNFIDLYSYTDANSNVIFSYFNRDNFKTAGITFENNIVWKNFSANIGFSYIGYYNRYQEDDVLKGDRTKFAWSPEITTNLSYKLTKLKGSVGLYYKFTGKIPTYILDANNDIVLSQRDAFHWADLTASKQIFKYFTLQGGIKNLFDVTRLSNNISSSGSAHVQGGSMNYAYGRSYFLGIIFQWNKK
ncbi:MAG: TonB-dependent receptor [Chitinophagaceae bacterium]|nr:TonB-dependent receptor [Chitinophagaceae bacterium]MCW5904289.1 TonB-dependent receptor [Chitinophagaceae bacterium]